MANGMKIDQAAYSKALTEMTEDLDTRLTEEQKAAGRRMAARYARGDDVAAKGADARELMMMLGVHTSQKDESIPRTAPAQAINHDPRAKVLQ